MSNLIDSAPDALNALNELAAALNDDSNYPTAIQNQLKTKNNIKYKKAHRFDKYNHDGFIYYIKKNPFGKTGDYITAPNISRLFSEMIAIWTISFWQSLGSQKRFL